MNIHHLSSYRNALLASLLALTSACSSVQLATPAANEEAQKFTPASGTASLYIYRSSSWGVGDKAPILLDGILVGETTPGTYLAIDLVPGTHSIMSSAEGKQVLDVKLVAGEVYFVQQAPGMTPSFSLADSISGKAAIRDGKRISAVTAVIPAPITPAAAPPKPTGPQLGRGEFEYYAEDIAKSIGCKTDSGERPKATLIQQEPGLQVYSVACRATTITVRCDAGACRPTR